MMPSSTSVYSKDYYMSTPTIESLFRTWWEDSYSTPPAKHTVLTHVAFGEYLARVALETLKQQENLDDA